MQLEMQHIHLSLQQHWPEYPSAIQIPADWIYWHEETNIIAFPECGRERFNSCCWLSKQRIQWRKFYNLSQKWVKRERHSEVESRHLSQTVILKKGETFSWDVYSFPLTIKRAWTNNFQATAVKWYESYWRYLNKKIQNCLILFRVFSSDPTSIFSSETPFGLSY